MNSPHMAFTLGPTPGRVVFGTGSVDRIADEVATLGLRRIMVVAAGSSAPPTRWGSTSRPASRR